MLEHCLVERFYFRQVAVQRERQYGLPDFAVKGRGHVRPSDPSPPSLGRLMFVLASPEVRTPAADGDPVAKKVVADDLRGNWLGTIDAGVIKLRMGFVIQATKGGGTGEKLVSIDQGNVVIAVDAVEVKDDEVSLAVGRRWRKLQRDVECTVLERFPVSGSGLADVSNPLEEGRRVPGRQAAAESAQAVSVPGRRSVFHELETQRDVERNLPVAEGQGAVCRRRVDLGLGSAGPQRRVAGPSSTVIAVRHSAWNRRAAI